MSQTALAAYHNHIDLCPTCLSQPGNMQLCPIGEALLVKAVESETKSEKESTC